MTDHNQKLLTVMTWNVYFGMDVGPPLSATNLADLIAAFATAWEQVQFTNIPERAEKIAEEIARTKPDLVGLQEVAQFFITAADNTITKYDFLESIILALSKLGLFYVPLTIRNNLDQTVPVDMAGSLVRIIDRDAVLLRIGEPPCRSQVRPYSVCSEAFSTLFQVSNPLMGPLAVPRGWIAVNAMLEGSKFRLIETHLESLSPAVQTGQAKELITGPAKVELPVIMVGDFNSNADTNAPGAATTYAQLIAEGFEDVWTTLKGKTLGDTCCQHANLLNVNSELNGRIDLIFIRGGAKPIDVKLVGEQPANRTTSGLWPSDHAGVVATLLLA
jgi:endonuclease/exonuclease/phosphatase family metal-dependent hydrolase